MRKRLFFGFLALLMVVMFFCSQFTYAKPSNSANGKNLLLTDTFKKTTIDTDNWKLDLGYAGSSITQNNALYITDASVYPTTTSVKSNQAFSLATYEVDICMQSPSQFWAQIQVMLTDSNTNQYGNNVQEVFMRKANVYWNGATWLNIPDTTPDSICISYQSRYQGNWGSEVVLAKNLSENAWYHVKIVNSATSVSIQISERNSIIGEYVSTRPPLNTDLRFYLGSDCESTSYALTGVFDNVKISALK